MAFSPDLRREASWGLAFSRAPALLTALNQKSVRRSSFVLRLVSSERAVYSKPLAIHKFFLFDRVTDLSSVAMICTGNR